jgi:hypothetical protein
MKYRPELYPDDWKRGDGPFAKAFATREARAIHQRPPKNELLFRRLCLAHNDFEDAKYAAEYLADWDKPEKTRKNFSIMTRPDHIEHHRKLLQRNCYETTILVDGTITPQKTLTRTAPTLSRVTEILVKLIG